MIFLTIKTVICPVVKENYSTSSDQSDCRIQQHVDIQEIGDCIDDNQRPGQRKHNRNLPISA